MLVAMLIEDYLCEMGHEVVGPITRIEAAIQAATSLEIDFGVLDINLAGEQSFPVADVLRSRGIDFMFASGYGASGLPDRFVGIPVLQKPFEASQLERLISSVRENR
jgi:DNA-binding NarL/FixJ family response regulator